MTTKTVTVQVQIYDYFSRKYNFADVEAIPTNNPHLFIRELGRGSYNLSHIPSGIMLIENLPNQKIAQEWAARFIATGDLDKPLDEMKKSTAILDLCREHWKACYAAKSQ